MSSETSLGDLVSAHDGVADILKSFQLDKTGGNESQDPKDITSEFSQIMDVTLSSTEVVKKFLEDVSAVAAARDELADLSRKTSNANAVKAAASLTHPVILGKRIEWCREAEKHLRTMTENKDLLIYNLQQPLVTNFLTMHHQFHKDLKILLDDLVNMLSNVPSHITLLQDHSLRSFLSTSDRGITCVTRRAADLRNTLEDITTLQDTIASVLVEQEG